MASISVKDAVASAKAALNDLYFDDPLSALALEEIELVKENGREFWSVTLGFFRAKSLGSPPSSGLLGTYAMAARPLAPVENRAYKTVVIDAETGAFVKMDMRFVE